MSASLTSVKSLASTLSLTEKMDLIAFLAKGAEPPSSPVKAAKKAPEAPGAPKKAPRAPKDPNAPKSDWLLFGEKVRAAITATLPEGTKIPGPVWMQTASALKEKGLMPSATNEQIVAAYQERLAHPPAPKPKAEAAPKPPSPKSDSESTSSQKKRGRKAKKDMTPEELAAHNARVAAKAAAKKASPAEAAAAVPLPAEPEDDLLDFEPFTFKKGKAELKLLRNKRGDVLTEDMEWFGHLKADGTIDMSASKPADLDL